MEITMTKQYTEQNVYEALQERLHYIFTENENSFVSFSGYALSTNPERKQDVHTYIFLTPPFTLTRTDLMFALQIALDLLWEWLTLLPKWAAFSQIAHFAMIAPP